MTLRAKTPDPHLVDRELAAAAARACDQHGDSEDARAAMFADIAATPQHLRADLLEHLKRTYPRM